MKITAPRCGTDKIPELPIDSAKKLWVVSENYEKSPILLIFSNGKHRRRGYFGIL